jgi:hypothetical protein
MIVPDRHIRTLEVRIRCFGGKIGNAGGCAGVDAGILVQSQRLIPHN